MHSDVILGKAVIVIDRVLTRRLLATGRGSPDRWVGSIGFDVYFSVLKVDEAVSERVRQASPITVDTLAAFFAPGQYIDNEYGLAGEILEVEVVEFEYKEQRMVGLHLRKGESVIPAIPAD